MLVRAIDACLFTAGAGLLLSGCFATKAQVVENDSPLPMPTTTVRSTSPPMQNIGKMTALPGTTDYSLDAVHQEPIGNVIVAGGPSAVAIVKRTPATFSGWAVDTAAHRSADAVYLRLDGTLVASCPIAIVRPDVAKALGQQDFGLSGFECTVPAKFIVPGRHTVLLDIVARGERTYYIVKPRSTFVVR